MVVVAQELAEYVGLVVFASQADYEYGSRIGVKHHVAQDFLGILVVVAQLGATIVMRVGHDGIHAATAGLFAQVFSQLVGNAVYAAHSGDDPYLVADTYITVFAAIAFEGQFPVCNVQAGVYRIVGVVQQAGQVGLDIVFVHPVTLLPGFACMSDGVSVFDDVFAFSQIFQCKFMSGGYVFVQCDVLSVHRDGFAGLQRQDGYRNVVGRIDFQVLCIHNAFLN